MAGHLVGGLWVAQQLEGWGQVGATLTCGQQCHVEWQQHLHQPGGGHICGICGTHLLGHVQHHVYAPRAPVTVIASSPTWHRGTGCSVYATTWPNLGAENNVDLVLNMKDFDV